MLAVAGLFFLRIWLPLLILLAVGALIERSYDHGTKKPDFLQGGPGLAAELGRVEAGVESVLRDQIGVRAGLDEAPAMQHPDQVSREDGAQAVRADDAGTAYYE
jgi:hypothetical protein